MIKGFTSSDESTEHTLTNTVDSKGRKVTGVALQYGHVEIAEFILIYRFQVLNCVLHC